MEKYKFSQEENTMIVNAIVEGYKEYVEHRKDRSEKMEISSAFAWTKVNFIESRIAIDCKDAGFSHKMSKAGPTWNYLQFIKDDTKSLFMIKNASYFNPSSFSNPKLPVPGEKTGHARSYLRELAKMNEHITFPVEKQLTLNDDGNEQTGFLYVPESQVNKQLELFKEEYGSFHILTYQLDSAQQVSKITHYLPDPFENIAYPIDDLTPYITGAELTDEEREALESESVADYIDPDAFDLGILGEEQDEG